MEHPHAETSEVVLMRLESTPFGLSEKEVRIRRTRYGRNVLPAEHAQSTLMLLLAQFKSPLLLLLVIACALSVGLRHYADAIFIAIFIAVNSTVTLHQERKASRALAVLRLSLTISARVVRGGARMILDSSELVPGDIIELSSGDKVPADARLITARDMQIDESSLTGEWLAVQKSVDAVAVEAPLAERSCMAYMGSVIEAGEARAVVVAIGTQTEIGRLSEATRTAVARPTPLQENVAYLARWVSVALLCVIVAILTLGIVRGQGFGESFVVALALTVSAIPANLLPAVTLILSLGMRRIFRRRALVRHLAAGETLGSVTVICTDKTGTLTQGSMEVSRVLSSDELLGTQVAPGHEAVAERARATVLEYAVLGTEGFIENPEDDMQQWIVRGRPTEKALLLEAQREGIEKQKLEVVYPLLDHLPFSSSIKYGGILRRTAHGSVLAVVGAPEAVLDLCSGLHSHDGKVPMTATSRRTILAMIDHMATSGLRLIMVAKKEYRKRGSAPEALGPEAPARLDLLGLVALKDPLRSDARESVKKAHAAGIRTVLITGDHPATARSIAREVGIDAGAEALTGAELDALSDEALVERSRTIALYARVSPEHKLRIVRALQKRREVVAMVGDGVNDAPALRAADVGIAVGSGTDVAKEAADMVLLDDSFRSIVSAVEEGRLMFRNIRKVFAYLIGDDLSELSLFIGALIAGLPLPLLPAQILWINIIEDALPVVGIAVEKDETGVMHEKPRGRTEPLAHQPLRQWLMAIFWISGLAAFGAFFLFLKITDIAHARSMIFVLLAVDSLIFSLSVRSFTKPIWRADIFANRTLTMALCAGLALTLSALYLPPLQLLLATVPLSVPNLLLVCSVSLVEIFLIEGYKRLYFKPQN